MRGNRIWLVVLVLAFLAALTHLVSGAFSRAPVFADYSTLRADPLGAKALFETLAALPDVRVERHVRRASRLAGARATVFWLGERPEQVMSWSKQELAAFEAMTSAGGRLVIGIRPAGPVYRVDAETKKSAPAPDDEAKKKLKQLLEQLTPEIGKRWGVQVEREVARKWSESDDGSRRQTAVWLTPLGKDWRCTARAGERCLTMERAFGPGSVVITADSFPLSNEGMRDARRAEWIAELVGPWKRVIFDEAHLGFEETGSVGTLIRQFRLEGAALMLVALAGLFIWRSSSSFLPLREPAADDGLSGDPHLSLTLLLRRSVSREVLAQTCVDEWRRAEHLLPYRQRQRLEPGTAAARGAATPLEAWRRVRQAIQEKS